MSLSSNSPTSPTLAVANTSELSALETAGLPDGELATTSDGSVWELHKSSATSPSATVIATKNSNGGASAGRWKKFLISVTAEEVSYDDALTPPEIGATTVQGAIDILKNTSAAPIVSSVALGAPVSKGDPGFVTFLTLTTTPSDIGDALRIDASVAYTASSDGNANCRLVVDSTPLAGSGFGSVIYTSITTPSSTAALSLVTNLDPGVAHTIELQWESPTTTPLSIDPSAVAFNQHATLIATPVVTVP